MNCHSHILTEKIVSNDVKYVGNIDICIFMKHTQSHSNLYINSTTYQVNICKPTTIRKALIRAVQKFSEQNGSSPYLLVLLKFLWTQTRCTQSHRQKFIISQLWRLGSLSSRCPPFLVSFQACFLASLHGSVAFPSYTEREISCIAFSGVIKHQSLGH